MKRHGILLASALLLLAALALQLGGCAATKLSTTIMQATGHISEEQAQSINRGSEALAKTFEDITPEQEHYIGRAVAATVLRDHPPASDPEANAYLNLLGQTLALASDRPETFDGYHFLLIESADINAFAAPGGLVLVTRGLLDCCESEAELAAVLAHEVAHVAGRHGLQAIKKGRLNSALAVLAVEGVKNFADEDLAELTEAYEGSILDITTTLVNRGYARELELEADAAALAILRRVGYPESALSTMLGRMGERLEPGGLDFAKTHPHPDERLEAIGGGGAIPAEMVAARRDRFRRALGRGV